MGESKRESVRAAHSKVREREGEPRFCLLEGGEGPMLDFLLEGGASLSPFSHGHGPCGIYPHTCMHACIV